MSGSLDRDTVNVVALDTYVKGVVPQEVPALWPTATVRSQAVAARTYAAHERAAAPAGRHYQLCDTAQCQVYGGLSAEQPHVQRCGERHREEGADPRGRGGLHPVLVQQRWVDDGRGPSVPGLEEGSVRPRVPQLGR